MSRLLGRLAAALAAMIVANSAGETLPGPDTGNMGTEEPVVWENIDVSGLPELTPETYPLAWPDKNLTLPIPPYPLQCYLGDDGKWKTRRYPEGMVRRPDLHYYEMAPLDKEIRQ